MIALVPTIQDGHLYKIGENIPDMGSLTCTSFTGNIRNYEGYNADASKLPTYDDLATGSSATLVDGTDLKIYKYVASNKTWNAIG